MHSSTGDDKNKLFVRSLAKGFALLEAFSTKPGPLSLNELATYSSLDRSAAQRVAHTLVALGYLERGANGRGYLPGSKCLDRTFDFLRSHPLIERATPILTALQEECGERVDLSLFDDLSIIYALRRQTKRQSYYSTLVGRRMPTFITSGGRSILASLSPADADDIIRRSSLVRLTPKSITDPDQLREKIAEARTRSYALAVEESLLGEIALGSAILDHDGRPVGAVHIAGSCSEWEPEGFARKFAPLAIGAARALCG
ncbi:helix-turn-helix domain-containing protein [Pusillimonas sp. TS35]|uniref:IclR family transcriptional regulator n=1 Tax=Paracandidimonas lactea TaxID=2895524 RepID=UPI00137092B0|nr:IclR family transcriptional regulator [Paracandidimonas lactea]MYN14248.1 helix-turn-helix domain-containing protein [Pusillimonas sp. TS35]